MGVSIYTGAIDRGLEGVVACTTDVSGIVDATLTYRGHTIEDLVSAKRSFEEITYLLWKGYLPSASDLSAFTKELQAHLGLSSQLMAVLKTLPCKGVHPMAWLRTAVSALALEDTTITQEATDQDRWRQAHILTAKMGALVAALECQRTGRELLPPQPECSLAWNLLYQLQGKEPSESFVEAMDVCLVLHADHELNCSAFTARVTASSLSDIYSSIVSAIGALKGPLHGGANEQVMRMLKKIGSVEKAKEWIQQALERREKVMGFGHRVYKNGDPRAKILRGMSERLTQESGQKQWYEMSRLIDDTVQSTKGLLPNVDFYSATVYYSMGIPLDLYTPIFAVSRISGWLAHVMEQYANNRIYRPRGQPSSKNVITRAQ